MRVELKLSPAVWLLEISIFTLMMLTVCFSAALYVCSSSSSYINLQYIKNWQSNYIIDVQVSHNMTCPVNYELKQIGLWSGIQKGSCLCYTNSTFHQLILENPHECNEFRDESGFICKYLNEKPPVPLVNYMNNTVICVLRSKQNFMDLWEMTNKFIRENFNQSHPSDPKMLVNDKRYMDFLRTKAPFQLISPSALIDMKIVNISKFSIKDLQNLYGYDLSESAGYIKEEIEPNYYLFKKRIGYDISIMAVNKLMSDVRLSNELQCAYLDMGPPKGQYNIMSYLDFGGYRYCEDLAEKLSLTFEDSKRTESLFFNFDLSPSKQDFYNPNGITDYYYHYNIRFNRRDIFSPNLVYEKYFSGIACPLLESIDNHLSKLNYGFVLLSLSKIFSSISFLTFSLLFILYASKLRDCNYKINFGFLIGIISLTLLLLILSFSHSIVAYKLREYLKEFSFYCQTDFLNFSRNHNAVKTSSMELQFYNELFYPYRISGFLALVLFSNLLFLSLYLLIQCRERNTIKINNQNVIVFQGNERKINMNQEMDNIEHVFHEVDKTDVKSRI
jgi:hypothetical protein